MICDLEIKKPSFTVKEISFRKIGGIGAESFLHDGRCSGLSRDNTDNLDDLVTLYNTTLSKIRGGEWYLEKRGSRKILAGSRNLGNVFAKSRSLVFTFLSLETFHQRVSSSHF